jgi:hypothetical protein
MERQAQAQTVSNKKTQGSKVQDAKHDKAPGKPMAMPAPDDDTLICLPIG